MKQITLFCLVSLFVMVAAATAMADNNGLGTPNNTAVINTSTVHRLTPARRDESDEVIWSEDFEQEAEGWTHDDMSTFVAWHKSDFNSREGEGLAWWCGDTLEEYDGSPVGYDNNWLQYLDSPVLDLSNAGQSLTLTFDAWWLVEDPRLHPPPAPRDGWDGFLVLISDDGGDSFTPLIPESPAYTADLLSSAERWWVVGDWPGWVFHSGEWGDTTSAVRPNVEWADCSFDLSNYRLDNIVLRWALISDRAVAAPFGNVYLQESGVLVDNIIVTDDDGTVFLSNDADDDPIPAELTAHLDPDYGGDFWELTDESAHSGDWSMWNDDDHRKIINYLDSPPIDLPDALNLHYEFWVWCDLPDWDSDGNNFLEDFYQVYLTNDSGATWTYQFHDWARAAAGGNGWTDYVPGTPINQNANVDLDLTPYAGQRIQLRWICMTDADDEDGNGHGLFIDDIEIIGENRNNRDAGMENLHVPYPLTVNYRTASISVFCYNYGIRDLDQISARWSWTDGVRSKTFPLRPFLDLASDEYDTMFINDFRARTPGWTPTLPGVFTVGARTTIGLSTPDADDDDENQTNDSVGVEGVQVWPDGLYELGYDNRSIQYYFNFDPGAGAAARFTPGDNELEEYSLVWAHFQFNGVQDEMASFILHVLGDGDEETPGAELLSLNVDVPVDSCLPNYMTVPLYQYPELTGLQGDFWLWLEITRDDRWPQIIGDDSLRGAGHYFSYDGATATPFARDLMIHAGVVEGSDRSPDLAAEQEEVDFNEVNVGESATQAFSLYCVGLGEVTITDVHTSGDVFTVEWGDDVTLHPGEQIPFNIVYTPPNGLEHSDTLTIVSDDETQPHVSLVGVGIMAVSGEQAQPVRFGLDEPYPNPFNSWTRVSFTLDKPGEVKLALYDLAGREVATLASGRYETGRRYAELNGEALPAGIYLMKLTAGMQAAVRKVALIK